MTVATDEGDNVYKFRGSATPYTTNGSWTFTGYSCQFCGTWIYPHMYHQCLPWRGAQRWPVPTTLPTTKEADVPAKQHLSVRLPGDLMDSLDVLSKYRKEDRTALVVRMLRYAIALKASTCEHDVMEERVCVECGHRFVEPSDDF